MDDCNLERLVVKPGKLNPAFHKDNVDYNVTVASNVEKINIDPLTSDTGASYSISGSGGEKQVPLQEGTITDIKIEVTSEDGTVKNYFLHVKRLSAKDATLNDIKFSLGTLLPEFNADITYYTCLMPCNVATVTVKPTAPDPKNAVLVNNEKPGSATSLNVGETTISIEVTSADGSNKQVYTVDVIRKQIPRYVKFTDPELARKFECPISLCPLYRPISIKGSDPKHTYSAPNIDAMTRTSKVDPISGMPLEVDWRIADVDMETQMAAATAYIPLTYGGNSDTVKFGELAAGIEKCNVPVKFEDVKDRFKNSSATIKHTVQVRKWEKNLHQVFGESNVEKLVKSAQEEIKKYFKSHPKPGSSKQYPDGESPLDFLQKACFHYAVAIKNKPKDANLHLQLGMVLEEKYYAEDLFGLKKEEAESLPSLNLEAKESSRAEECAAICKLRGVDAESAPLSLQLQAIDAEYHHLVENGQSVKADHVQQLFAWKSKQAMQEGAAAQKAEDEESPLGQAFQKYMDALVLDEAKAVYNFHVGRLLVVQGKYDDAVTRLEITLNWNSQHQLARCYLGLALALQKNGPGARAKETITYLLEAMEVLLTANTKESLTDQDIWEINPVLHAENLIRSSNVHLLRGIIQLGILLSQNPDVKECMSTQDIFHTAALTASKVLPSISKGDTYKQLEWVLLDAHSHLLNMLTANQKGQEKIIAQRCERLSALIFASSIPMNEQLLSLQKKTCQKLVLIQPCSSHSLFLLGSAQFAEYENTTPGETATNMVKESVLSYQACIDMEGKPADGDVPEKLAGQNWWQEKIKAEEEEKKKTEIAKTATDKAAAGAPQGAAARGRPARGGAARGAPAARGTPAARGAPAKAAPAARGRGTAATTPARGGAATRGAARGGAAAKTAPAKSGHTCEPAKPEGDAPKSEPESKTSESKPPVPANTTDTSSAPINKKTYNPRLGLARAYRAMEQIPESQKYYNEVITMAPEVHDAYIELAEMLTKTDPKGAVDVYCKFPLSEKLSFDDAYIIGEIVRLLMKAQTYDDPRLEKYMILYGKVLGLSVLEKYVKILEEKFKNKLLQSVYAGVNNKNVDDDDMQAFFKFKCWI